MRIFECYDYSGNDLHDYDPVRWIAAPSLIAAIAEASKHKWVGLQEIHLAVTTYIAAYTPEEAERIFKAIGCDIVIRS